MDKSAHAVLDVDTAISLSMGQFRRMFFLSNHWFFDVIVAYICTCTKKLLFFLYDEDHRNKKIEK